jgi:hypothetical protein
MVSLTINTGMLDKKTQQVCEGCRLKEGKKGMGKYLKALPDSEERGSTRLLSFVYDPISGEVTAANSTSFNLRDDVTRY